MQRRNTRLAILLVVLLLCELSAVAQQSDRSAMVQPPLFSAVVDGRAVELHEFEQGSFGLFEVNSPVEVEVRSDFDVRWVDIRPKSRGITPTIGGADHKSIRFRVTEPGAITIEFNDDLAHVLHLFAYAPEKDAPKPGTPNVRYFRDAKFVINVHGRWERASQETSASPGHAHSLMLSPLCFLGCLRQLHDCR